MTNLAWVSVVATFGLLRAFEGAAIKQLIAKSNIATGGYPEGLLTPIHSNLTILPTGENLLQALSRLAANTDPADPRRPLGT